MQIEDFLIHDKEKCVRMLCEMAKYNQKKRKATAGLDKFLYMSRSLNSKLNELYTFFCAPVLAKTFEKIFKTISDKKKLKA
jgi:hypothetical protein